MAEKDYRGSAGYQRMHSELTASFYREFPEQIRRSYVVNRPNDPLAEIEEAGEYLGVPNLLQTIREQTNRPDFPANQSGQLIPIRKPDGSTVNIAFGWQLARMADSPERLTPHNIEILAGVKLHELSHALSTDDLTTTLERYGVDSLQFYMARRLEERIPQKLEIGLIATPKSFMGRLKP